MYKTQLIEISRIKNNPFQPRKVLNKETIKELANSINKVGLLQPIVVNISSKNDVTLIAGQRRVEAYKILNKDFIEATIIPGDASELEFRQASVIENIQREEMSTLDTAQSIKELKESGLNLDDISKKIGKSRSWVSKIMSIFELNDEIKDSIASGELDISKATIIASQKNLSEQEKVNLKDNVVKNNVTKKELENLVKNENNENVSKLQNKLQDIFKTKVSVKKKSLVINFQGEQELNRILEILNIND